jgi:glycosyltransferase involved in cell wall biosynthesis
VIGDNIMVVNSHRAAEQWGFGEVIIHGMDENEWWDLPKEPRVVTMISPAGLDKYYDRLFLRTVKDLLEEKDIQLCHITVDAIFKNFDEYRNFLGRSLIYFNPTRESPMPRARTEAMFSGCCVVTTVTQDADTFIKNGENGFLVKRIPEKVANLIEGLIYDYEKTRAIGQKGRQTALKLFSSKRYCNDWLNLINKVIKR